MVHEMGEVAINWEAPHSVLDGHVDVEPAIGDGDHAELFRGNRAGLLLGDKRGAAPFEELLVVGRGVFSAKGNAGEGVGALRRFVSLPAIFHYYNLGKYSISLTNNNQ